MRDRPGGERFDDFLLVAVDFFVPRWECGEQKEAYECEDDGNDTVEIRLAL